VNPDPAPREVPEVATERLRLRRLVEDHVDRWYRIVFNDPEVMRYLPSGVPVGIERTRDVFRRFENGWSRRGMAPWGVELKENGELIGHCGLRHVGGCPGDVEVLYALGRHHWGRGYATEAAAASVRFGFERAGLERIVAFALPRNSASRRVLEKIGMTHRGRTRVFGIDAVLYGIERGQLEPEAVS